MFSLTISEWVSSFWFTVPVQDGANNLAFVVLQGVAKIIALILPIALAKHTKVILHFFIPSLTRRWLANQGWSRNVSHYWGLGKNTGS